MLKWPHPKNSVLLFQIYTTVKHSRYLLSPWQWQGSKGLRPLPFGSTLCSSAPLCTPLHVQMFILFSFSEGAFNISRIISEVALYQSCTLKCLGEASGSVPGQSKEKSRTFNKLTWNKIYSSSFNEYQNILPGRERNHFYLLWILASSFNALSSTPIPLSHHL